MVEELKDYSVLNSKLAVKVMENIASCDKGDYGSNLARKLDKSQASVSRIINELREAGFIRKGRREKAQYYVIDYESTADFWHRKIYRELEQTEGEINRKKWLVEGYTDKEEMIEGMEEYQDQIKEIFSDYLREVLESNSGLDNMTVSDLLFESFAYSIGHNMIRDEGFLEENPGLEYPKDALVYLWNLDGFARELESVVKRV